MHARVIIIGNPVTNISSGKFLIKFVNVLTHVVENVTIINDGRVYFKDNKVKVIAATNINARIERQRKSLIISLVDYGISQITSSFALLRNLRRIDVVVLLPISFVFPSFIGKLAKKKIVLYEAQDIFSQYHINELSSHFKFAFLLLVRNVVLRISDHIIVEAENIIKILQLHRYRHKIHVCPQYVDVSFYNIKKAFSQRKCLIGFIASMERRKGIIQFANAIELVLAKRDDVHFLIVGEGSLASDIKKRLEKYLLQGKVRINRYVPEKIFPDLLNELILYVLPSFSEGLPNSILEAMACGTLVITTPVGGIPDVVKDLETGFLLKDNSPNSIAEGIIRALNYQDIHVIVDNGRRLIENNYSFEDAVRRYKHFFMQIGSQSNTWC